VRSYFLFFIFAFYEDMTNYPQIAVHLLPKEISPITNELMTGELSGF